MRTNRHHARAGGESGYTFLEVIMGLLILSIAAIASLDAIIFAMKQFQRIGEINELNILIASDLALVRTANDRLVCNDGSCAIASSDPGEADYFPAILDPNNITPPEQANINFFVNMCTYTNPSSGFAAQLESLLPPVDERLERTLTYVDTTNPNLYTGHRYTVTYTRPLGDTTIFRQVTLVPATVAWCPRVP